MAVLQHELTQAVQVISTNLDTCLSTHQQQAVQASSLNSSAATDQLYVLLCLVSSPAFRAYVVTPELIEALARHLLAVNAPPQQQPWDEQQMSGFRASLLQVVEAATQVSDLL